jgi:1-phosphatidylinositol-3-phosphate 5-kinase
VYYAEQFDTLRRTCGVEDVLVRSMAKCEPAWKAQGGKTRSRSNFCKTSNDRFIIKTLVNAWNIDQLYVVLFIPDGRQTKVEQPLEKKNQVPINLAPSYFLFITLDTETVQGKEDLVVIENLFYSQKPTKTFGLKDI